MRFRHWIINELASGSKSLIELATAQIWKVIAIPKRTITEAVHLDQVKAQFSPTNWTPLYKWISTYIPSFEPGRTPDMITFGSVGYCYFFGNHVVKFTDASDEAEIASLLSGHNIPEVAIKDVVKVNNRGMWAIMQERVETNKIPDDLLTASMMVGRYLVPMYIQNPVNPFPFFGGVKSTTKNVVNKFGRHDNSPAVNAYVEILLHIIHKIEKKTGRVWADAGTSNVGMKNDKPALFDLGYNYATRRKRIPKIREV